MGIPGLISLWPVITVVACLLSALLLIVFWERWLAFGVASDVALLILAVTRPHWLEHLVAGGT